MKFSQCCILFSATIVVLCLIAREAEADKLKVKLIAAKIGAGALLLKKMKNRKLFVAPFPLPVPLPFPVHKQPIIYPPPKTVPIIVPKYTPVIKYVPRYVPIHTKKEETYVFEDSYPSYSSPSYSKGRGKKGKGKDYAAAASNIAGLGHLHGGIGLETSDLDHLALDSIPLKTLIRSSRRSSKKNRYSGFKASDDFMRGLALDDLPIETLESLTKEIKSLRELSSVYPSSRSRVGRKAGRRYRSRPYYAESKVVETIVPAPLEMKSNSQPFGMPSSSTANVHKITDFSAIVPYQMSRKIRS